MNPVDSKEAQQVAAADCNSAQAAQAYVAPAQTTLLVGGPGSGKTQQLVDRVQAVVSGGGGPPAGVVVGPRAPAAPRVAARGPAGVRVSTPLTLALEELRAAGAGCSHRLATFEETFFLEDMRVTGQKQRRLREMLKFLERGWSEMRDDEDGWLITGEEMAVEAFARRDLRAMGSLHVTQVAASCARHLAVDAEALANARYSWVFADDYQAMSRASQRLVRLVAADGLVVAWNTVGGLVGEEPYGYADGLDELVAAAPDPTRVDLAGSVLAQEPARAVAHLCAQPCMDAVEAPRVDSDAVPGGFEVLAAEELSGEMPLLAERVAELLASGVAPEDVYVATPTDAWARRACAALEGADVPVSRVEERQALGGDIRDKAKSAGALAYTALHLAADPASAVAWRCWCGFGDYLACSASMTALGELADQTGSTLPELLRALEAGELVCDAVDQAKVLARYREGQAMLRNAEGRTGRELLAVLCERALGSCEVPAALVQLLGGVDDADDACALFERAQKALVAPAWVALTPYWDSGRA